MQVSYNDTLINKKIAEINKSNNCIQYNTRDIPFKGSSGKIQVAPIRLFFFDDFHIGTMQHHMNNSTKAICIYLFAGDREEKLKSSK